MCVCAWSISYHILRLRLRPLAKRPNLKLQPSGQSKHIKIKPLCHYAKHEKHSEALHGTSLGFQAISQSRTPAGVSAAIPASTASTATAAPHHGRGSSGTLESCESSCGMAIDLQGPGLPCSRLETTSITVHHVKHQPTRLDGNDSNP